MGLYYGTKIALEKCGLYKEEEYDINDVFLICDFVKMQDGKILKTKEELINYCKNNSLDYEKLNNKIINNIFEYCFIR